MTKEASKNNLVIFSPTKRNTNVIAKFLTKSNITYTKVSNCVIRCNYYSSLLTELRDTFQTSYLDGWAE